MFNKNPCVWALLCGVFTTPLAFAQIDGPKGFADTPAQRFIPLPSQSGPNDLSEQAAMLQQLQQMLNLADLLQSSEVQQQLDDQLDIWLDKGIIKEVVSPWSARLIPVPKKNGKIRV